MKTVILFIVTMNTLNSTAIAQTPMPEIPDRVQCDNMAKKAGRLNERYPSHELYYGCLVAESVPTLLLESQANMGAGKKWASRSLEDTTPADFIKSQKTAEANVNAGAYAAQYAIKFLRANTLDYYDTRDNYLEMAALQIEIGDVIRQIIAHNYTKLDAKHPSLELGRLESRMTTLKYCEVFYENYKTGRMTEVERSFLLPQTYQERVFTCAGVGVNFYDLLFPSRMGTKANEKVRRMCEQNPDKWNSFCAKFRSKH